MKKKVAEYVKVFVIGFIALVGMLFILFFSAILQGPTQ